MRRHIGSNRRPASRSRRAYNPDGWQEVAEHYAGLGTIYLVFTLTVILSWIPSPIAGIAPFWSLPLIYLWSFRYPYLMPGGLIFAIGLLSDVVIGTPLGVHAFALLGIAMLARIQQRFLMTQSFVAVWANFAAASFVFSLLVTSLTMIASRDMMGIGATFMTSGISWGILALLFPIYVVCSHGLMAAVSRTDT